MSVTTAAPSGPMTAPRRRPPRAADGAGRARRWRREERGLLRIGEVWRRKAVLAADATRGRRPRALGGPISRRRAGTARGQARAPATLTTRTPRARPRAGPRQPGSAASRICARRSLLPAPGAQDEPEAPRCRVVRAVRRGRHAGADLDALTAAAGGGPISALLAGWAASGHDPGSHLGRLAPPGDPSADPTAAVFPTLALLAFVADADARRRQRQLPDHPSGWPVSSGFCADVSTYLSAALGDIVDTDADPPAWLRRSSTCTRRSMRTIKRSSARRSVPSPSFPTRRALPGRGR